MTSESRAVSATFGVRPSRANTVCSDEEPVKLNT